MRMSELGRRIFPMRGYLGIPFFLTVLWFCEPDPRLPSVLGWLLLVAGLAMRLWGVAGWVPRRLPISAPAHLITRDGPYVYTRNPRYLGNLLMGLGGCQIAGLSSCLLPYTLLWALVHLPIIAHEEQVLLERHGSEYAEYRLQVPRFLGPPKKPFLPQLLPLRWDLAFCLEMATIAGWGSFGCYLQCWRWAHLGAPPQVYIGGLLAGALLWLTLMSAASYLRKRV